MVDHDVESVILAAELNIAADPEAAFAVFDASWDLTIDAITRLPTPGRPQ